MYADDSLTIVNTTRHVASFSFFQLACACSFIHAFIISSIKFCNTIYGGEYKIDGTFISFNKIVAQQTPYFLHD
jgi:hypothetical protein